MNTNHYLLCPDGDTENSKLCFLQDPYPKGLKKDIELNKGRKLSVSWTNNVVFAVNPSLKGRELQSVLGNDGNLLLVDARMKNVIAAVCEGTEVEYLPFVLMDQKGKELSRDYYLVNPIGTFNAMDAGASTIDWNEDGTIFDLEEVVLDRQRSLHTPPLFRLHHAPQKMVINRELAQALHEHKFTNLYWQKLRYNDDPELIEWMKQQQLPAGMDFQQLSATKQFIGYVQFGKIKEAKKLLAAKPFIDMFDRPEWGLTALMYAAAKGYDELLQLILNAGADINIRDREGRTALYLAVQEEKETCVRLLLEAGADPDISRMDFLKPGHIINTPLMQACYLENKEMVRLLLEYNADPNLNDHNGKIAFHATTDTDIRTMLVEAGTNVNTASASFSSPFFEVAGTGPVTLLQIMVDKGAIIDIRNYDNHTPLMNAAQKGQLECVQFLLENGADINAIDEEGNNAVPFAFKQKHVEVVEYLISKGAKAGEAILQRISLLKQKRTKLIFDHYAEEVAVCIQKVIQQSMKKIRFAPVGLEVYLDEEGGLESIKVCGETEKQHFGYPVSPENAPIPYSKEEVELCLAPFREAYQLKTDDIELTTLIFWQLYKHIAEVASHLIDKPAHLLLIRDNDDHFKSLYQISRRLYTELLPIYRNIDALQALGSICLENQAEQKALISIIDNRPVSYGLDELAESIIQSSTEVILQHRDQLKDPVSGIKLLFYDFVYLFPAYIELDFTKGETIKWPLTIPENPLPDHLDQMTEEDYLLPDFLHKHHLNKDSFRWGDIYRLPHSLWWLELMQATQQIIKRLKEEGIRLSYNVQGRIGDAEEDHDNIEEYIDMIQDEIRKVLKSKTLLTSFSALCYKSKQKQEWFINFIKAK